MTKFQLGDVVTHDFSGGEGKVVGLRVLEPYTVMVQWGTFFKSKKDWYDPKVLRHYDTGDTDKRLFDYLVVARATEGEGRAELQKLFPVYKDLANYIEEIKKAAYEEGYADCQDTYGDGPSS